MNAKDDNDRGLGPAEHRVIRPAIWQQDRHIMLGVSHPSDDPSRHRVFEVRATFDATRGGWAALVGEQDLNEQRGEWGQVVTGKEEARVFPTAATCLGHATATIIAAVDRDVEETP